MDQRGSVRRNRFEILAPLGQGGFGSVFEAIDWLSGERVALKELNRVNADSIARFKREFRALAGLHHPNLVGLNGLFEQEGHWYIAMELVPGSDLLTYLRSQTRPEDGGHGARLRAAFAGIHAGLVALHDFGILHRDLKPSNVNVTPEGRAVLLDFGLVTSTHQSRQSTLAGGVGTAAYMAPEQAMGEKVGPAADWYAFGACLFEALTGELPHDERNALRMIVAKQSRPARRASELTRVPPDLDALCADLLQRDPRARPDGQAIANRLGLQEETRIDPIPRLRSCSMHPGPAPFVGRDEELRALWQALEHTRSGQLRMVLIEGEPGVGKSQLVSEFLHGARRETPELLSLWGRCHADDDVAYRGFDSCVDELARTLRRMDEAALPLMGVDVASLTRVFPVLLGVPALRRAAERAGTPKWADTAQPAFEALVGLLRRLAEERPVVLALDDLHCADVEAFALLEALLAVRPSPSILVLATLDHRSDLSAEAANRIDAIVGEESVERMELAGLPRERAEELVSLRLGQGARTEDIHAIASESLGHPLLVEALATYACNRPTTGHGGVTLEAAVWAQVGDLTAPARALMELTAVAGRPVAGRVLAAVLGIENLETLARPLLARRLLERGRAHELACSHPRIRAAVLARVPANHQDSLGRQLSELLSRS